MSKEAALRSRPKSLSQLLRDGLERSTRYQFSRDLAQLLDPPKSAEHVRRCLSGEDIPSTKDLHRMCDLLKIDHATADALAFKARVESVKKQEALRDPAFQALIDAWVKDPDIAMFAKTWQDDPQFGLLTKIYTLLTAQERERVFKTAIALRMAKAQMAVA